MSFSSSGATIWSGSVNFSLKWEALQFDWPLSEQADEVERQLHKSAAQELDQFGEHLPAAKGLLSGSAECKSMDAPEVAQTT